MDVGGGKQIMLIIKETINLFQLTILLVGMLLVLGVFYIERSINYQFASSKLTLDSLLRSQSINK